MRTSLTLDWLDEWLDGVVHRSVRNDPSARARQERFLVARWVSAAAALACIPGYLVFGAVPRGLDCLALVALAAPLLGAAALMRFGRLGPAQAIVSGALTLLATAIATLADATPLSLVPLLLAPLDALFSGSRRAIRISVGLALAGLVAALALAPQVENRAEGAALAALLPVAIAFAFGHAVAQVVLDRRLQRLFQVALRTGEAREGAALQAIDDLVTWHDRNGSVLRANSAAHRLVQAPASSLMGRGLFNRVHVADRPAYLKAISDAALSSEPVVVQLRLQVGERDEPAFGPALAQGRILNAPTVATVEMRAHRLVADGEAAVIAVTRDVSEHVRRIEELEALRRQALEAGEMRSKQLAVASHELRTPLNAIIGYSELLMGRDAPSRLDPRHEYAAIIHQSGQLMHDVVSTLLDLSAVEAGRYELAPEPLRVADLVEDSCRPLALMAERAGVVIARDVPDDLPELVADRRACQQILLNLLSNAVKFTPHGGLITVEARREGDRMAFRVRDTGVGVQPSELARLGDPFFRASSARACPQKGSGLGLSVVRGLVALHHGRMTLASVPGDGLCATVTLPLDAGLKASPAAIPISISTKVRSLPGRAPHQEDRMTSRA